MRNSLLLIGAACLMATAIVAQPAAPTMPPTKMSETPPPQGLVDSFGSFFTEADTHLGTFDGMKFGIELGSCFENNVNADAALRINYVVYKHIEVESLTRIWNSAQTVKCQQAGIGVGLPVGDLKFSVFGVGGYNVDIHKAYFGVAAELAKGISQTLFASTRVETDVYGDKQIPYVGLFIGKALGKPKPQ